MVMHAGYRRWLPANQCIFNICINNDGRQVHLKRTKNKSHLVWGMLSPQLPCSNLSKFENVRSADIPELLINLGTTLRHGHLSKYAVRAKLLQLFPRQGVGQWRRIDPTARCECRLTRNKIIRCNNTTMWLWCCWWHVWRCDRWLGS